MEACNAAESLSLNSKKESSMSLTFPLKSAAHYGSETGNHKEWTQDSEEDIHFKLFVMLIDTLPWGYTAFFLKVEIINRMLSLFPEFAKKNAALRSWCPSSILLSGLAFYLIP